jgi:hypothetical protein
MTLAKVRKEIQSLEQQLQDHSDYKAMLVKKQVLIKQIEQKEAMPLRINWKLEADFVKQQAIAGKTEREIGELYGVSGARIGQVLTKFFPDLHVSERGKAKAISNQRQQYLTSLYARTGRGTGQHDSDLSKAMAACFTRKKHNAKKGKWEWLLSPSDLAFPTHCPILGIELDWFAECRQENSPSFDRVNPLLGYIPGNVLICSWRANRIKNDGTAEEHWKIADFMEQSKTT